MNISTVNELIQSLESAGELSIREQKFLKLAKAFKQLAEENVGLRPLIAENWNMRDLLRQLMAGRPGGVYFNKWEKLIVRVLNETPATNRIVAGIKADAIDEAAVELDRVDTVASTRVIGFKLREFSQQLREGAK
ncbi:hypothetical protein ACQY0K_01115 [Klebsiella pneumoniae]|uniref:hypothetical protein n=1 Tax=Klebsiella pneumoniae TaxID=573 RepID=UPI001F241DA2|nr:hypothetical protein [Klebsiella pneumoniae]MCY0485120.1 hypothetical protein [Klebsiella pneumoniae]MDZ3002617.1 hypothetical protein [Klebsiella pneumoniae]HEE4686621.1 hypothetical protein [Klebsiella pneumoniae]HEE4715274.1 hypothetical protein [Klebsiella pneumoniae]HEE4766557.1 hypothetical protein [Klebsiella pneumoniae]